MQPSTISTKQEDTFFLRESYEPMANLGELRLEWGGTGWG